MNTRQLMEKFSTLNSLIVMKSSAEYAIHSASNNYDKEELQKIVDAPCLDAAHLVAFQYLGDEEKTPELLSRIVWDARVKELLAIDFPE